MEKVCDLEARLGSIAWLCLKNEVKQAKYQTTETLKSTVWSPGITCGLCDPHWGAEQKVWVTRGVERTQVVTAGGLECLRWTAGVRALVVATAFLVLFSEEGETIATVLNKRKYMCLE